MSSSLSSLLPQIYREKLTSFGPHLELNPRLLEVEWAEEVKPPRLVQKLLLKGSKDSNFLTMCHPPSDIGMSVHDNENVQLPHKLHTQISFY